MSWITDVILIFSAAEEYDENENDLDSVPALNNINAWLRENNYGELLNIGIGAGGGNSIQAGVYGGAFKSLKIGEFIQLVKRQEWNEPENVQLLIQDEDESRFTLHTIITD